MVVLTKRQAEIEKSFKETKESRVNSELEKEKKVPARQIKVKKEASQKSPKKIPQVKNQRKLAIGDDSMMEVGSPVDSPIVSGRTGIKQVDLASKESVTKAIVREATKAFKTSILEILTSEPNVWKMLRPDDELIAEVAMISMDTSIRKLSNK